MTSPDNHPAKSYNRTFCLGIKLNQFLTSTTHKSASYAKPYSLRYFKIVADVAGSSTVILPMVIS